MPAITNVNELQAMNDNLAGNYWLANDIDASATVGWNGGAGFVPIDNFQGSLNGKGHIITGLYINRPTVTAGLFGEYFYCSASLKNLRLNADIRGDWITGGFIGYTGGTGNLAILNCHFNGNVKTSNVIGEIGGIIGCAYGIVNISKSSVAGSIGNVIYNVDAVGGMVGQNRADLTIEKSFTTCSVIGAYYIGGIIGISGWGGIVHMNQIYSTGNITGTDWGIGGLIGDSHNVSDLIMDSYARGNITGDEAVGGAFGSFFNGKFGNVYSTGKVTGNSDVGGLHGYNGGTEEISPCFWDIQTSEQAASISGTGKTTSQMKNRSTFTNAGWNFITIWGINGITNNGYPFFWIMPPEPPPDAPRRTISVEDKITLETIRNVEMAAMGRFRIGEDGKAIYRSRYARNP